MDLKAFQMLEYINNRLSNIEKNIARIDEKLEFSIQLQRNHLIRVKNGEDIDDSIILMGRPYNDLSPNQAFQVITNSDSDYMLLDVSAKDYTAPSIIEGSIYIPFEELNRRAGEIINKTTPILIISENGLKSIQAAELLVKMGFYNINNISGGHAFWPGHEVSVRGLKQKVL
jgi:rhodanese-related sulfurtransferase